MKTAQINQVFTFMLVAIVIIATVLLSIKLLGVLTEGSCDAEFAKLQATITDVATTFDAVGTKQTVTLKAACGAQYLCVFSQDTTQADIEAASLAISPGAKSQLASATLPAEPKPNVFLIIDNTLNEVSTQTKFVAEPFCVQAEGGRFTVRVEGQGRTIALQP